MEIGTGMVLPATAAPRGSFGTSTPSAPPPTAAATAAATPAAERFGSAAAAAREGAGSLRVAQLNLWNMYDHVDTPGLDDPVVDEAEYRARLEKLAHTIANDLGTPDVISLQELEGQHVLDDLLALPEMKELGYRARAVTAEENNYKRGNGVGLLYRGEKLELVGTSTPNPDLRFDDNPRSRLDPNRLYTRPPLMADFKVRGAAQAGEGAGLLTIVAAHFKSKLGGDQFEPRRQMQGEWLGGHIDALKAADPSRRFMVVGDLNALYEDGAYQKLATRKDGSTRLYDTPLGLPEGERYTYVYRGQKNMLDHVLVSPELKSAISKVSIERLGTPTGAKDAKLDTKTGLGMSDHDVILTDFDLSKLFASAS